LWLSALNVQYRDVQYAIPFLIQAWMYASPVAYSAQLIPEGIWRVVYGLNPLAGVIQGFRWALLGGSPPDAMFWASVVMVLLLLVSGLAYFAKMEERFADVI
jgi:lipopolysaccharide transport system permease protein